MIKDNEIKESKEDLLNREKRLLSILETTQDGFFIFDKNKKIIDVNKAYCEMSGYKKEEILNLSISDIDLYDTSERIKKVEENLLSKGHDLFETKHLKKNGEIIDIEVSISLFDEEPAVALCFCRDITEKKKYERRIIEMKERLEKIIEGSNSGIWQWNIQTGKTVFDKRWAEILGYKLEEISPVNLKTWENLTHPHDLKKAQKELERAINKEIEHYDCEIRMKHKNGKWIWIDDRGKVTKWSEDGKAILMSGIITDITEKKEKQKQIEYLSFHDPHTGLYNRRYMEDSLKRLDTDRNIPFSIIAADVNNLKHINDSFGHEMGDKLLISTAEILKKSCRKEDIICRIGGDEFVILLPSISEYKVKEIIGRIKEESKRTELEEIEVSLATGYSTKNKKEENILDIYKEADTNMYKNKTKYGRKIKGITKEKVPLNINNKHNNKKIYKERKISIKNDEEILLINLDKLFYIEVEEGVVYFHTDKGKLSEKGTLKNWEEKLKCFEFYRCHKNFMINLNKIEKLRPTKNNSYLLKMHKHKKHIPIARDKTREIKEIITI